MSAGVSFARSLVRVAVVEEAVVHLEPAEHIPADVTSRGVIGKQGGGGGRCVLREEGGWGKVGKRWLKGGGGRAGGGGRCEVEERRGGARSDRRRTLYNDRMGG